MAIEELLSSKNVSVTVGMDELVGFLNHIKSNYIEVSEVRDRLVDIPGAISIMGVTRCTLNNWRNTGYLSPALMRGKNPLYRIGDLLDRGGKLPEDLFSISTYTEDSVNNKG